MSDLLTIRDKVMRYTTRVFDDVRIGEDGSLAIPIGSTVIHLNVKEFTDPEVVEYREKHNLYKFLIETYSIVLYGVQESPEFFKWIAAEGGNYFLGHFKSVKQNESELYNLVFETNIIADELDELELRSALWMLAMVADGEDEKLQQKFGGKRALES